MGNQEGRGWTIPTLFRHQLCFVVHCRAKSQQTPSIRLYRSITYNAPRASNQVVGSSNLSGRAISPSVLTGHMVYILFRTHS